MKLCTDCKWSKTSSWGSLLCGHERNINLGTGEPELSCETQRMFPWLHAFLFGMCGKSGRWFEPKTIELYAPSQEVYRPVGTQSPGKPPCDKSAIQKG